VETTKGRPDLPAEFHLEEEFSADVVRRLRDHLPSYESVPFQEHVDFVHDQMRDILEGVAQRRPPGPEHLARSEELGWRRAAQRVPVHDVMEAYHFCFREMWRRLVELTDERGEGSAELLGSVDVLWSWTHGLSSAVANAHAEASRTRYAERTQLRRRLFDALARGDTDGPVIEHLASGLSFDPAGPFQAVCVPDTGQRSPDEIEAATRRESSSTGVLQSWAHDGVVTVLGQHCDAGAVAAALTRRHVPVGVGLLRHGLAGARASMTDASMAMDVCQPGDVAFFADLAPLCVLFAGRASLEQALAVGAQVADEHPQLAATVLAFSRSFRIVDCARELHLHPNSAKYRLIRWAELTGWDPMSFPGLLRSVASIELFGDRRPEPGGSSASWFGLSRGT
jgi:hypothetical protein